jgi:hypothetical protein
MVVAPQPKSVIGAGAPAVNVPKPPDSTLNRAVVAKVAPPPQTVPFAVQQKMIQQNGGHPVSASEIQRLQVQQHLAPVANPVQVKIAPPVAVGGNQMGANPGQPRQNDAKQNQHSEAAHSEKDSSGKPVSPVISPEQANPIAPPVAVGGNQTGANPGQPRQRDAKQNQHSEAAHSEKDSSGKPVSPVVSPEQGKPVNQQNAPVRDMRAPSVNQPEHANQPQITNVTNKSEVKANSQTPSQPAVPQKDNARKDQSAPVQAPISKNQAPIAESKPSDAKSQNAAPAANNNPANRPPAATSQEDQRKQAEPKGQEQKGQQAQQQQKPDKNQKASDKPAQQPDKNQKAPDKPAQQPK